MESAEHRLIVTAPHGVDGQQPASAVEGLDLHSLPRIGLPVISLFVLAFLGLLASLFLLGWIPMQHRESQLQADARAAREAHPVVEVAFPKPATAAFELKLPGDSEAMQETAIYPRANGYLKKLYVDVGDHVEANTLLAEIDSPEVDAELLQGQAALKQAEANANKTGVDMRLAQKTLDRYRELAQKQLVSPQDIDEKQSAFDQAKAAYDAAQASTKAAKANVDRLRTLQGFEKVWAPFTGTITARNYDLGALLSSSNTAAGRELFRIEATNTLRVFVNVPQSYATMVRPGQTAEYVVRNYPDRPFTGKVVRSTKSLNTSTRTLRVEVDFDNPDHLLLPGMYGEVRFRIEQSKPSLTVPTSALVFGTDGLKVAVVADGKVHFQKVSVGRDLGTEVELAQGLYGTEQVVTNPDERLVEGAPVEVASNPAKPPAHTGPMEAMAR